MNIRFFFFLRIIKRSFSDLCPLVLEEITVVFKQGNQHHVLIILDQEVR